MDPPDSSSYNGRNCCDMRTVSCSSLINTRFPPLHVIGLYYTRPELDDGLTGPP
ncbi:hypothetical protein QJS04_geneDACA020684 [Acorus gramineus]|uniref:Uncharacterized protein n=1 Tax=Acorus gramineus TaxID=55184 RepID=A0AAV9BUX2_ACOGR|nr:hypothetical protein QJS04_geneDACA020684 [Acorus gramineus]